MEHIVEAVYKKLRRKRYARYKISPYAFVYCSAHIVAFAGVLNVLPTPMWYVKLICWVSGVLAIGTGLVSILSYIAMNAGRSWELQQRLLAQSRRRSLWIIYACILPLVGVAYLWGGILWGKGVSSFFGVVLGLVGYFRARNRLPVSSALWLLAVCLRSLPMALAAIVSDLLVPLAYHHYAQSVRYRVSERKARAFHQAEWETIRSDRSQLTLISRVKHLHINISYLSSLGLVEEASHLAESYIALEAPTRGEREALRAQIAYLCGDDARVFGIWREGKGRDEKDLRLWVAKAYLRQGEKEKARHLWEKLPTPNLFRWRQLELLADLGDFSEVLKLYMQEESKLTQEERREEGRLRSNGYAALGRIFAQQGANREAAMFYEEAIICRVYWKEQEIQCAIRCWREAGAERHAKWWEQTLTYLKARDKKEGGSGFCIGTSSFY